MRFEYSSANYDTLGLIVQVLSGQPYETYLQEHIFAPLDMRQTFTSVTVSIFVKMQNRIFNPQFQFSKEDTHV